jgi:DNA repair exonuclease SbcCD ATPase subunit
LFDIDYFKKFFPSINLQPELKEESKVVQPEQKRSVLSRFTGLFGSNKKSGAINIEESLKKIEESIKKQREEYAQVAKKEGEEDNINRSITDAETKFLELKEVKKKIDALNVKINDSEIVNKKKIELSEVKEKSEKGNATKDITAVDKELADLKKNPKNNKKRLQKEAQKEKETAEAEFKALEDTLNTEISGIQADIDKLKNNKGSIGGGKRIKYKSTGDEVVILYKNRESKKTVYVKEKTVTKYCKINNKYILLSKLKVIG